MAKKAFVCSDALAMVAAGIVWSETIAKPNSAKLSAKAFAKAALSSARFYVYPAHESSIE